MSSVHPTAGPPELNKQRTLAERIMNRTTTYRDMLMDANANARLKRLTRERENIHEGWQGLLIFMSMAVLIIIIVMHSKGELGTVSIAILYPAAAIVCILSYKQYRKREKNKNAMTQVLPSGLTQQEANEAANAAVERMRGE